ncbi:serine hydrolase domain-containing protein [Actinomycetospora chiangmaiensis]|uniref:serine hydrolase domain-containing protein n=1 Tax=Actinomycetospora chiangmaiensis TaxID=402650 RepID=UPI000364F747|nr:serine hydrolase domain-containing protein [Actinomycetospora chiangmaiensis]
MTALLAVAVLSTGCAASTGAGGVTAPSPSTDQARAIAAVVDAAMTTDHLRAAIVKVTVDGREVLRRATGESMPGVPASPDMHFRDGAVAISYVATALLRLVDDGKVSLEDRVSRWLPEIPYSDQVTLGQLAQMTSGYVDYVSTPELTAAQYADPLRRFTPEELIAFGTRRPLLYPPGTNWNYSHTNYVILGLALEKTTGRPMAEFLQDTVLRPLGLVDTVDPGTPAIPEPALHAYTAERRQFLGIPAGGPFLEESTYWDPSWTITRGAIQTTTIDDLATTATAVGSGTLLSPASHQAMLTRDLIGRTTTLPGCTTCFPQSSNYTYGLGVVSTGDWVMQNPMFAGEAGAFASLPSRKVAIAVAVTFDQAAFDPTTGAYRNMADRLWRRIAATLVPDDAPPMPPGP